MDFLATQIFNEDLSDNEMNLPVDEEEPIQVGTLIINSKEYEIYNKISTIGRLPNCDIVLDNTSVSKVHAEIEAVKNQGEKVWICDLDSSNKTRLDDEILRSHRYYEVKDGSNIKFGTVCAIYRARSNVIPETPAPSRKRITDTVIPSTPDSSAINSSSDASIIYGTQKDEQNSVFRRPSTPQEHQSTSIGKKNTSQASSSESNDSQIALHVSDSNISKNREPNDIFDMETQKFDEHEIAVSKSSHEIETQISSMDMSTILTEATRKSTNLSKANNSKDNEQSKSKLNVQDKIANTPVMDIHDMETQLANCSDNLETQKNEDDTWKTVKLHRFTDIHDGQVQIYIDDTKKNKKKVEIDKNKKKDLDQVECDINDLETQRVSDNNIAEDISNVETQSQVNSIKNTTTKIVNAKSQFEMDDIASDIDNDQTCTDKDVEKPIKNATNDDEKDRDNVAKTNKTNINYDDVAQSLNFRSSSPGSLNLSSPGIDEDSHSSLQHSDNLLEASDLLEFFAYGIDKEGVIPATNTSTPKSRTKPSSERDNAENDDDDDSIFDAPTQHLNEIEEELGENNEKDATRELSEKKSIDDDPGMDTQESPAKVAEKQRKSFEISDKSCNDNINDRNDPATSIESDDLFNALTQHSNNPTVNDTSNSSVNQLSKVNKTNVDNDASQITNNDKNTHDQGDLANKPSADINSVNNAIENGQKGHVGEKKLEESVQSIDDSVEKKLSEMFDDVNTSINEPPSVLSQALEEILESQSDDDSPVKKNTVNKNSHVDSASRTQLEKKKCLSRNQSLHNPANIEESNVNRLEIDSQNSDDYFSTLSKKRKRNILKETQELVDSTLQDITSCQDSNTSRISKISNEKVDDNKSAEINTRRKIISRSKNKPDIDTLNDNDVTETISNGNNERNLRRTKRKHGVAAETDKALRNDLDEADVDNVGKGSKNMPDVCVPSSSKDVERTQTSGISFEDDDDILARLPAVRISGTLSNPPSPASSTSTVVDVRSDQNLIVKDKNIKSARNESLRKQNVKDFKGKGKSPNKICNKSPNQTSNFDASKTDRITKISIDSEDSDNDTKFKRFQQMASRMLRNNINSLKQYDEKNGQNLSDKKKNVRFSSKLLKDSNEDELNDTHDELKNLLERNLRPRRNCNKQNSENLSHKETCMENTTSDKSTKSETKSIVSKRKRTLLEKDNELTQKCKVQVIEERTVLTRSLRSTMKTAINRQSPNILDNFTETSSRENSPVIENTKSFRDNKTVPETTLEEDLDLKTDESIISLRSGIKRAKRKINDDDQAQDVVPVNTSNKCNENKQLQMLETQIEVRLSQSKILKVVLSPITSSPTIPMDDESHEVETIMAKNLSHVQDKNLSIRETSTARIFENKSRLRSRKQLSSDIMTDSTLTESSTSSITDSSDSQSEDFVPKAKNRKTFSKYSKAKAQASKKEETFKKPTRVNQNSASSIYDSSTENSESSQNSMKSDIWPSSRSSRLKMAVKKTQNIKVTRNTSRMLNDSACSGINSSTAEVISIPPTPTRMRRSASILNSSILSTVRHKVLFTGIMEDYTEIVRTLGGIKVEDPNKCSILVTDKVRRTYKFLCALAKGIPIVTIEWLKNSESATRFLDWEDYILKDPASEAKFGFKLRKSLNIAKEIKLLDGYTIVLTPNVAPPPVEELKDMIAFCGGKALLRPPNKWPEKALIISREEDLPNARKFLAKAPKRVTIQSTEFILTGILRQETDFDKYKIM